MIQINMQNCIDNILIKVKQVYWKFTPYKYRKKIEQVKFNS